MIEFKTEKPVLSFNLKGKLIVSFEADKKLTESLDTLPEKSLIVTIKEYRQKRSLDANAYFWTLCDKVAEKLNTSKEEIYKEKIKECGVFEIVPLRNDAVERYTAMWGKNGLGWFCEVLGASKLQGYTNVITYFGSSTYNSKEMSRIVESIVEDCRELKIPTVDENELLKMYDAYRGKNG
jgi:hypothetical protein